MAVLAIVAAIVVAVLALDQGSSISSYRVIDDRIIAVTSTEGTGAWTRVARLDESAMTVTIEVRSLRLQLGGGTAVGILTESIVNLRQPLGNRTVIDASTGMPVSHRS